MAAPGRVAGASAPLQRYCQAALLVGIVVLAAALVRSVYLAPVGHDEVEHAHVGFRILNGDIPYQDFRQNHFPLYWLVTTLLVAAFEGSAWVILAGRWVSIGAALAIAVSGLRFLRINGLTVGRSGSLLYAFAFLAFALPMQAYMARPDVLAAALIAAGIASTSAAAMCRGAGLLAAGALAGAAIAVSPKTLPLALAVPLTVLMSDATWPERGKRLSKYAAGIAIGLVPLAAWIAWHGIGAEFFAATVTFNLGYSTRPLSALPVWRLPLSVIGATGAVIWYRRSRLWTEGQAEAAGALLLATSVVLGLVIPLIARNHQLYNYLPLLFAWTAGCAVLISALSPRLREIGLVAALLIVGVGFPWSDARAALLPQATDRFTLSRLQQVIELARPGDRCLAFAPYHPIFCHDVSELSLGWDFHFAARARGDRRRAQEQAVWQAATAQLAVGAPDLVLRRSPWRTWDRAAATGLAPLPEQSMPESVRASYDRVMVGDLEFWVRRGRTLDDGK